MHCIYKDNSIAILILSVTLVCCDELKIIPNISEINLFLGDTHVITCIGTAQKEVGFWLDPKEQQLDQSRGRVHMEKKGNLLLLVFKKIQAEDEGVWTCVSLNETSRIRFKLKLSESIHFENLTSLQTIVETKNEVVTCLVSGKPLPQVSWTFNGKHIIFPNEKYIKLNDGLLIKSVARTDGGEYSCKAFQISETIANTDERTIRVNVKGVPVMTSRIFFYGYLGGHANITCTFESDDPVEVEWKRKGNEAINTKSYTIFNDTKSSNLQIFINRTDLFGEYICIGRNAVGSGEGIVILSEGAKPKVPQTVLLRSASPSNLELFVRNAKTVDNLMKISGYKVQIRSKTKPYVKWQDARTIDFKLRSDHLYIVDSLEENTKYTLRIATKNVAGTSDWTSFIEYSTTELNSEKLTNEAETCHLNIYFSILFVNFVSWKSFTTVM